MAYSIKEVVEMMNVESSILKWFYGNASSSK